MNYLVVALGNPGEKYEKTRHNAGWIAINFAYPNLEWKENKYAKALVSDSLLTSHFSLLAKPLTFMNNSGETVKYFIDKESILPENIIVVYDDIDLPIGKIKISYDRGSGGHNGIKSIEEHVGGRNFTRIRIGISKILENGELVKPNVLGNFEDSEMEKIKELSPKIKSAIEMIIREGREAAMTEFNK